MQNGIEEIPVEGLPLEFVQKMAGYVATSLVAADRAAQIARILPPNLNGHGSRGRMSDSRRRVRLDEANNARQRAIGVSEVLDALAPQDEPWLDVVRDSLRATESR